MTLALSRREFLKATAAVGGGLSLQFSFPLLAKPGAAATATEVNAWVVIHPDETVAIRIARSEMGQGTMTALAQLVAEELECDWARVKAEFASPNEHVKRKRIWGSMSTGGSAGVRASQDYVRKAGAAARHMLVTAASVEWGVPTFECKVNQGVITHPETKRSTTFGKMAAKAATYAPPKDITLKDPKDWTIAGKPMKRLDIPDKVLGKPVFGVDVQVPGMLHASVAQCPVFGGKVKSIDASAAEKLRGVKKVVREDNFVAVVADNWWRANQALKQVKIEWDVGTNGNVSDASITALFREGLAATNLPEARKIGDTAAALSGAAKVVEAEYSSPYLNHATMEPQTCTAWFKPDGTLEVWTSTQNAEASMAAASEVAGIPQEKIEVHKPMLGGGFGRRGAPQDFVRQGVAIAKQMPGTPVKMMWTREEDMQHGFYRPASLVQMKAGIDKDGNVIALHTKIACPSILALVRPEGIQKGIDFSAVRTFNDMTYTIPNQQVDYAMRNPHVPVGFWRAPGLQNAHYRECFIDELAHAAGKEPLAFRLAMMKADDKNRKVLEAAAKAANWGSPLPAGVFRGIAQADGFGSFTAMVAEVSVSATGELKIHRIVFAIDSGHVVNPDTCAAQAESNVIYGIGGLLYQANTVKDGRIQESNFNDFPLPKLTDMPKVETVLVPTGGFWGGHGEPGILALTPAICNAIFAATGKRIRTLPLKAEDLKRA